MQSLESQVERTRPRRESVNPSPTAGGPQWTSGGVLTGVQKPNASLGPGWGQALGRLPLSRGHPHTRGDCDCD